MDVAFEASFARDLRRIRDRALQQRIRRAIDRVKAAKTPHDIPGLAKMENFPGYYRIRVGEYRIGIEIVGSIAIFVRVLHRRDIYRYFP